MYEVTLQSLVLSGQVTAARSRPTLTINVFSEVLWGTTRVTGPPSAGPRERRDYSRRVLSECNYIISELKLYLLPTEKVIILELNCESL